MSGLLPETTEEELEDYFISFGKVEDVLINCDRKTGKKKGFGFIRFEKKEVASGLISSNKTHHIGKAKVECRACYTKKAHSFLIKTTLNINPEGLTKPQDSKSLKFQKKSESSKIEGSKNDDRNKTSLSLNELKEALKNNPAHSEELFQQMVQKMVEMLKPAPNYIVVEEEEGYTIKTGGLSLAISKSPDCQENHNSDNLKFQRYSCTRRNTFRCNGYWAMPHLFK